MRTKPGQCQCVPPAQGRGRTPLYAYALAGLSSGLLSSGCCLVQLAFNALSLGCAGFAALDSSETFKAACKALTIAITGHLLWRKGLSRGTLLTAIISLAVMQSQDVVRFSNQYPESITQLLISCLSWRHKHGPAAGGQRAAQSVHEGDPGHVTCTGDRGNDGCMHSSTLNSRHSQQDQPAASSTPSASGQPSAEPHRSNPARRSGERTGSKSASSRGGTEWDVHTHAHAHEAVLHYNVAGIKCEGCAARLKQRVLAVPGVTRCTVAFSTGDVHVWALTQDGSSTAASTGPAARQHQHQATQPLSKGAEGSGNRHGLGTGGAKDGGSLAKSAGLIAGTSSMEGAMARGAVAKKGEDRSPLFPEQLQGSDFRTASTMRHMVGAVQSTIQLTDLAYRVTYLENDD